MAIITLYNFDDNKVLGTTVLADIPRVGEYFILSEEIEEGWEELFYIVKSVTHTLKDGYVSIHLERYDVNAARAKEEQLQKLMEKLRNKVQGDENGSKK